MIRLTPKFTLFPYTTLFRSEKYFLASTCSIYGFNENICDENSKINPLTTYAKASSIAEKEILDLADDKFCTTAFRFATMYGLSDRKSTRLNSSHMSISYAVF